MITENVKLEIVISPNKVCSVTGRLSGDRLLDVEITSPTLFDLGTQLVYNGTYYSTRLFSQENGVYIYIVKEV